MTGSTGLVGSELCQHLRKLGHLPVPVVRREAREDEISWDPAAGRLAVADLEGLDAVVHLAGENISEGRWTDAKKKRIRDSRVESTRLLAESLAQVDRKPTVFLSASAIGYYGDKGHEVCTEASLPGDDFLARVCQEWEAAAGP
ncbi:MAG: NAD-dependent epimerase/dehydratase family protein, partial [Planctomycetales bacterium]|nr:NAD-dependent epimerase/dehydratase family protein [Planctomycetales bacterium]